MAVICFLLLFLIPMFLRATVLERSIPGTPRTLAKLHNIACLFEHKPEGWSSYYVQVLYPGEREWTTLDQRELFGLQPFGRRTRMHRLLIEWGAKPSERTRHMASWVVEQHEARHPELPPVTAVRFAQSWTVPTRDEPPRHGWQQPEWIRVPPKQRRVVAVYMRDELLGQAEVPR